MCKERKKTWKEKAVIRNEELKSVKKELKRQHIRAESWRSKYYLVRADLESKNLKMSDLMSAGGDLEERDLGMKTGKIRGYKYSVSLVFLCVNLYSMGLSLRAVSKVLGYIYTFLGISLTLPSYSTISIWVHKVGLHLLKTGAKEASTASDGSSGSAWSLVVDTSHSLGKSELLLILGIHLSSLKKGALGIKEVVPIYLKSQETWKASEIKDCLVECKEKLGGEILYVTSDQGNNLLAGAKEAGLPVVWDWSHYMANTLEAIYKEQPEFERFNTDMGKFKRKRKQSIYTHYSPPNLSVKVRFMNYLPFLEWAGIMWMNFSKIPPEIQPELQFLKELKSFIFEMSDLFYAANTMGKIIKKHGISPKTQIILIQHLRILERQYPLNTNVNAFIQRTMDYLQHTLNIYEACKAKIDKEAPNFDALVASSDTIEAIFGKLKHRMPKNPKAAFSANSLLIPIFTTELTLQNVANALKKTSFSKLNQWKNDFLNVRKYVSFRNVFN